MCTRKNQLGMSVVGMLLIAVVVGALALITVRVTPMYVNNAAVASSLRTLAGDAEARRLPSMQLRGRLMKHLDVNNIDSVGREHVKITKVPGGREVSVNYEVRSELLANLDVVGRFEETVLVPAR